MLEITRLTLMRRMRSTLVWSASLGLSSGLILASYALFDTASLKGITDAMSSGMFEALGTTAEGFLTPEGYFGSQFVVFLPAILAFYLSSIASGAIAGAEQDRSLDVVLAQPVPRWWVPMGALLAAVAGLVVVLAGYAVLTLACGELFGVYLEVSALLDSVVALFPICLFWGGLAMALSATLRRPGEVTAVISAIVIVTYLANTIALLVPDLDWLGYVSPFHYFGEPMEHGVDGVDQLILLAAAALCAAASVPLFGRRDVRA